MLRPRGELGQLYEPRRGAGSPCVFTELCGAVGLLMRGSSAETISFPLQRFFSKTELHVLPPTPAHAAPGRERPGALQSARRQTSSAEEEARPQHPLPGPRFLTGMPAGRTALCGLRGEPVRLSGPRARPAPRPPCYALLQARLGVPGQDAGEGYCKGQSVLRKFVEADQ